MNHQEWIAENKSRRDLLQFSTCRDLLDLFQNSFYRYIIYPAQQKSFSDTKPLAQMPALTQWFWQEVEITVQHIPVRLWVYIRGQVPFDCREVLDVLFLLKCEVVIVYSFLLSRWHFRWHRVLSSIAGNSWQISNTQISYKVLYIIERDSYFDELSLEKCWLTCTHSHCKYKRASASLPSCKLDAM